MKKDDIPVLTIFLLLCAMFFTTGFVLVHFIVKFW